MFAFVLMLSSLYSTYCTHTYFFFNHFWQRALITFKAFVYFVFLDRMKFRIFMQHFFISFYQFP